MPIYWPFPPATNSRLCCMALTTVRLPKPSIPEYGSRASGRRLSEGVADGRSPQAALEPPEQVNDRAACGDHKPRGEYPSGNVLYQSNGRISNIRFSPQGDKIAFMDHPVPWDNRGAVCVVDLAGKVRTLSKEWESEQGVAWRPDGKEIWFTAIEKGTSLNLMAVTLTGKVRTVLDLPTGIALQDISSDGRVLVALNSKRLAMGFSTLGGKEDVELILARPRMSPRTFRVTASLYCLRIPAKRRDLATRLRCTSWTAPSRFALARAAQADSLRMGSGPSRSLPTILRR